MQELLPLRLAGAVVGPLLQKRAERWSLCLLYLPGHPSGASRYDREYAKEPHPTEKKPEQEVVLKRRRAAVRPTELKLEHLRE